MPVLAAVGALFIAVVLWKLGVFPKLQTKLEEWAAAHTFDIDWWAITARIIFFDYQIISKFSEMQNVKWPSPFNGYMKFLDIVFFDFAAWFPGIECTDWSVYRTLLVWTSGPIILWVIALTVAVFRALALELAREDTDISFASMKKVILPAVVTTTASWLAILSLIHTLICVEIFTIFECDKFELSREEDKSKSYLASDYSQSCRTDRHRFYRGYAILMTVVYVFLVPAGMAWTRKRHASESSDTTHRLLDLPYKRTCKF